MVNRTGPAPASLRELRRLLAEDNRRGWAVEDGHVTEGFASIAACAFDHGGPARRRDHRDVPPRGPPAGAWPALADPVRAAAADLTRRLAGRAPG